MIIVWLKKDLRLTDHQPLQQAVNRAHTSGQPIVLLYLIEPTLISSPDSAPQHHQFAMECLGELIQDLPCCCPLLIVRADAELAFEAISEFAPQFHLFSHQETGNWLSFERDKQVARLLKSLTLSWHEYQTNAVVRGQLNRDEWSRLWLSAMDREPFAPEFGKLKCETTLHAKTQCLFDALAKQFKVALLHSSNPDIPDWAHCEKVFARGGLIDKANRQRGGRKIGMKILEDFYLGRGRFYRKEMSSPLSAESACSRISPYLAYGALSVFEVMQSIQKARSNLPKLPIEEQSGWKMSLKSFESRIHWHCHFIQKLETEPELEFRAAHRLLNDLRRVDGPPKSVQQARLKAWIEGRTGFPMVDACMRMLRDTGWVNFRMRAMLVAFASYQLWLDWRLTAPLLAREFLDYEPGIHYPQFQMQSGVTGINILRIYNPVKQAQDQDPNGEFIKRWLPELAAVPTEFVAQPWKLPAILAEEVGYKHGKGYPHPIVDPETAIKEARQKLSSYRAGLDLDKEAQRVYRKHGSRHPNRNGSPKKAKVKQQPIQQANSQMNLFGDDSA